MPLAPTDMLHLALIALLYHGVKTAICQAEINLSGLFLGIKYTTQSPRRSTIAVRSMHLSAKEAANETFVNNLTWP